MHQSKVSSPKRARMHVCDICYLQQETGFTVKPVLNGHSKIDKAKILMTNGLLCWYQIISFHGLFKSEGGDKHIPPLDRSLQPYCVLVVIFSDYLTFVCRDVVV